MLQFSVSNSLNNTQISDGSILDSDLDDQYFRLRKAETIAEFKHILSNADLIDEAVIARESLKLQLNAYQSNLYLSSAILLYNLKSKDLVVLDANKNIRAEIWNLPCLEAGTPKENEIGESQLKSRVTLLNDFQKIILDAVLAQAITNVHLKNASPTVSDEELIRYAVIEKRLYGSSFFDAAQEDEEKKLQEECVLTALLKSPDLNTLIGDAESLITNTLEHEYTLQELSKPLFVKPNIIDDYLEKVDPSLIASTGISETPNHKLHRNILTQRLFMHLIAFFRSSATEFFTHKEALMTQINDADFYKHLAKILPLENFAARYKQLHINRDKCTKIFYQYLLAYIADFEHIASNRINKNDQYCLLAKTINSLPPIELDRFKSNRIKLIHNLKLLAKTLGAQNKKSSTAFSIWGKNAPHQTELKVDTTRLSYMRSIAT